ncbi:hypothetical protein GCK72_021627 [Caenorhabditis remanei]|uniref:Uncharacterized protein n=1 Tax=Caenorhabditis remanei TaxID=31234 RepID=A0A6A5GLB3_CAERE|nr:hypothetical protein GCK72_021627 [Caenorhabditis remanei]KAF1755059.1 hypothetical protein GCK72_021627 [Caenorhabditis remanei]
MSNESFDHLSDASDLGDVSNQDQKEDPVPLVPTKQREDVAHQKLVHFVIVLVALCFLAASNPKKAAPVANTTINTTFDATAYRLALGERQMLQRTKLFENEEKIARAQRVMQSRTWSKLADVPEYYWDKYIPDPTRFEGVEMYLHMTKQNGTQVAEALYFYPIKFRKGGKEGDILVSWPSLNGDIFDVANVGSCDPKTECLQGTYQIEKGDLVFEYTFTMEGGQKLIVKHVFYIPVDSIL